MVSHEKLMKVQAMSNTTIAKNSDLVMDLFDLPLEQAITFRRSLTFKLGGLYSYNLITEVMKFVGFKGEVKNILWDLSTKSRAMIIGQSKSTALYYGNVYDIYSH